MQSFIKTIRVNYCDTDQMGYVHHSNYLKYFETARWGLFRQLGIPYKELEEKGFLLPVIHAQVQFIKPAFYDEQLQIETSISLMKGAKLVLNYKIFNENLELINTAKITLAFVSIRTRKPCKPPEFVQDLLTGYLEQNLQK